MLDKAAQPRKEDRRLQEISEKSGATPSQVSHCSPSLDFLRMSGPAIDVIEKSSSGANNSVHPLVRSLSESKFKVPLLLSAASFGLSSVLFNEAGIVNPLASLGIAIVVGRSVSYGVKNENLSMAAPLKTWLENAKHRFLKVSMANISFPVTKPLLIGLVAGIAGSIVQNNILSTALDTICCCGLLLAAPVIYRSVAALAMSTATIPLAIASGAVQGFWKALNWIANKYSDNSPRLGLA